MTLNRFGWIGGVVDRVERLFERRVQSLRLKCKEQDLQETTIVVCLWADESKLEIYATCPNSVPGGIHRGLQFWGQAFDSDEFLHKHECQVDSGIQ